MGGLPALGDEGTAADPDGDQVNIRMALAYDSRCIPRSAAVADVS
jgi:hypothetical protein